MRIVAMAKLGNKIETCKKNGENFEKKLWQGMKRNEFLGCKEWCYLFFEKINLLAELI